MIIDLKPTLSLRLLTPNIIYLIYNTVVAYSNVYIHSIVKNLYNQKCVNRISRYKIILIQQFHLLVVYLFFILKLFLLAITVLWCYTFAVLIGLKQDTSFWSVDPSSVLLYVQFTRLPVLGKNVLIDRCVIS